MPSRSKPWELFWCFQKGNSCVYTFSQKKFINNGRICQAKFYRSASWVSVELCDLVLCVCYVGAGCSPLRKSADPEERKAIGRHILCSGTYKSCRPTPLSRFIHNYCTPFSYFQKITPTTTTTTTTANNMKAIIVEETNFEPTYHNAKLVDLPKPELTEDGQALLDVHAVSFNHREVWIRKGVYPVRDRT